MLAEIEATLGRFRVRMDRYASERSLLESGAVDRVLSELEGVYESEGALWLRTTAAGDDKDRVLRRSTGELAYFAPDIAYHADKLARGYDHLINVLGSDHHGYVKRIYAAWQALGGDPDAYEIVIMQLVNLFEGGRRAQMSKREGAIVTLDALLDDIGVDAARWYLTSRSHDTSIDLDLELARSQSQDNPVYYVQYAHARIASILRKAGEQRLAAARAADLRASAERFHPSARVAGQAAAGVPRRGARGGGAARAAPDDDLRPRDRTGVLGLLPGLQGGRGGRGGRRRAGAPGRSRCWRGTCSPARSTCSGSRRPTRCRVRAVRLALLAALAVSLTCAAPAAAIDRYVPDEGPARAGPGQVRPGLGAAARPGGRRRRWSCSCPVPRAGQAASRRSRATSCGSVPRTQVWIVDRREQAFEDASVFRRRDPDAALDYYLGFHYRRVAGEDAKFVSEWGLSVPAARPAQRRAPARGPAGAG